jgi:hypothetical protein
MLLMALCDGIGCAFVKSAVVFRDKISSVWDGLLQVAGK